ncbi:MAG: hypothetical protein AAFV37_02515 [Pseudomonadota bacterium]
MSRTQDLGPVNPTPAYWMTGLPQRIAAGLCGIIAVLIALKSVAYDPSGNGIASNYDHFVRVLSFAALPVWITFTIGMSRRNAATIISLVFAVVVELLLVPTTHSGLSTITAANLGIVLSYCSLELYWRAATRGQEES